MRGSLWLFVALVGGCVVSPAGAQEDPAPGEESACLDFASPDDAQAFFEAEGGPEHDPHGMDSDGNGAACDGVEVGVLAESSDATLAQGATPDPNAQGPPGSAGQASSPAPTTTGSATPTPAATQTPASPTPSPSALPKSGGPVETYGITGGVLLLAGLLMSAAARSRRAKPRRFDEYSLIGW